MDGKLTRRELWAGAAALAAGPQRGLIGHWPLEGNANDASGLGHHGENHGAALTAGGARFDGRSGYIEIPGGPALRLGTGDFTMAARIHTERVDDAIGDIACQYDPEARRGFHFGVMSNAGTFSQANHRQAYFGIDNGQTGEWVDSGRPGNAIFVMALAAFDGSLYAGTCERGGEEAGHVYRHAGGGRWEDCGAPDKANAIAALAAWQGRLYAGSARYNLGGSSLAASPNENPGGRVYRYEGGKRWSECGQAAASGAVSGMAEYGGRLYASSLYKPAGTWRYEGGRRWSSCGTPDGKRVEAMAVYNGALYGTGYDAGEIYRYEGGERWSTIGRLPETTQTYGFAIHCGKLYVSTWPQARVYRYDGDNNWADCGRLGSELEVMGMAVYNGKLYGGTLPLAEVYRYEGGERWTRTGQLDRTPQVRYRRAWSMAVHGGQLFCGTLPSGRVYAFEAGRCATDGRELPPGWRRLAAVRSGGVLKLYIDGKLAASSTTFDAAAYDLSNGRPLRIGFGGQDHFHGTIRDVRLYGRALGEAELP